MRGRHRLADNEVALARTPVAAIALLARVYDAVAAARQATVGATGVRLEVGIGGAAIARVPDIDHAIAATLGLIAFIPTLEFNDQWVEYFDERIEFRTDSGANVHAPIGRRSFSVEQLADNARAFVEHLRGLRPAQAKGSFVTKVVVASTMSPGISLTLAEGSSSA